jgi:spermidine synthase
MFVFLRTLPQTLVGIYDSLKGSFAALKAAEFAIICVVVAVPTILMGTLLPISCRILGAEAQASGRAVGRLYAWNTLGCILGSAGASFALIPLLGLDLTLRVGAALSAAVAIVAVVAWARRDILIAGGAVAAAIVAFVVPGWDVLSMSLGAYIYGPDIEQQLEDRYDGDLSKFIKAQPRPIATYWDSYALVTVHRLDTGHLALRINGKTDASTGTLDQATQVLASAIPMAIHPDPREVLVIGLGSGVTLANVVAYPDVQAECVELCPAVKKAADEFREATDDVLHNPRARVIVNDARTHVQYTRKRYDLIVSEPSNLWLSGMATLFTREYFATARARLKPGGMMAQWLHAYRLSVEDFRAIVRTYVEIFPQTMLWETHPEGDYLLVSWTGEPRIDLDLVAKRLASLPRRPEREYAGLTDPAAFMGNFVAGPDALARVVQGARPVTDDHCWIEYTAPQALYGDERTELVKRLTPGRSPPVDAFVGGTPAMRDAIDRHVRARRNLAPVAVTLNPQLIVRLTAQMDAALAEGSDDPVVRQVVDGRVNLLLHFAGVMQGMGRIENAAVALRAVPARHALFADAQSSLGKILVKVDNLDGARDAYRRAWQAKPGHPPSGTALAEFLTAEGNPKAALDMLAIVLRDAPDDADARVARARALWKDGQVGEARAELDRLLASQPKHVGARELLTEILK